MFQQLKTMAKESLKLRSGIHNDLKEIAKKDQSRVGEDPRPLVSDDTTKQQFEERYHNVQIVAFALGFLFFFSVLMGVLNINSTMSALNCALAAAIFVIAYYKTAFKLWCARNVYMNWEDRSTPKVIYMRQFTEAVAINFAEIFPLPLRGKTT